MPMVTGYFGTMTDAYVRALQKKAKLRVSGIVGKKTWKKVGKVKFKVKTVSSAATPAAAKPSGNLALLLRTRGFRTSRTVTRQLKASTAVATRSGFTSVRELISAVRTR